MENKNIDYQLWFFSFCVSYALVFWIDHRDLESLGFSSFYLGLTVGMALMGAIAVARRSIYLFLKKPIRVI